MSERVDFSRRRDGEAPVLATASTRRMEITLCFVSRLRFRLSPHCLYKTIDAFSGCLYPQLAIVSRPPMRETFK
jgi:hypothetical protein